MAININNYVDITSGVGAGAVVARRDLIGRLFSDNNLLPPQTTLEFTSAAAVGAYFTTSSEEYLRSLEYFSWISKNLTRPQKIQFSRWVDVAVAPRIYGNVQTQTLGTWTAITAGSLGITIGADVNTFTALDFSSALSLSDVASILETAIQTKVGTMWTSATVTYDATRGSFNFVGGSAVDAVITVQQGVGGTPIGNILGWLTGDTLIVANGSAVESITDVLTESTSQSNNFGSFLFMPSLNLTQVTEAATWNKAQNVMFMYTVGVSSANYAAWSAALLGIGGTALTLSNTAGAYPEQMPMMIEAATNYDAVNSVQNYMFQQFPGMPAEVTTDALAASLNAARVNYYGRTQEAGQFIDFYQRGVLMGGATDPLDMNTYVNEIWLKDAATAAIMTLLLALAKVSANAQGRSQILAVLQSVINEALNNGTISVGKTLTETQKMFITEITGDPQAYYQVQTIGYWIDCVIVFDTDLAAYKAVYELVYSKDDVIRKVEGTHVLI